MWKMKDNFVLSLVGNFELCSSVRELLLTVGRTVLPSNEVFEFVAK